MPLKQLRDRGKGLNKAAMKLNGLFQHFGRVASKATGHPLAFVLALAVIFVWAVTGPIFGFSDTWQLVINTGTTVVTFLMVFLIQNSQNRDTEAMQLKLDELLRAVRGANNAMIDLEEETDQELGELKEGYGKLAKQARILGERADKIRERSERLGEHAERVQTHASSLGDQGREIHEETEMLEDRAEEIGQSAEEIESHASKISGSGRSRDTTRGGGE